MNTGRIGQVVEEQGADSPALVGVRHYEGHFSFVGPIEALVAAHADDPPYVDDHERHAVHVVDGCEPLHLTGRQVGVGEEKPSVDRSRRQALVKRSHRCTVGVADRAYKEVGPVPQSLIGLEPGGIVPGYGRRSGVHSVRHRLDVTRLACGPSGQVGVGSVAALARSSQAPVAPRNRGANA
jgi:hypothetical protein